MNAIVLVAEFLGQMLLALWNAIGTWGIIGVGIIAPMVIKRVANLVKKVFEY